MATPIHISCGKYFGKGGVSFRANTDSDVSGSPRTNPKFWFAAELASTYTGAKEISVWDLARYHLRSATWIHFELFPCRMLRCTSFLFGHLNACLFGPFFNPITQIIQFPCCVALLASPPLPTGKLIAALLEGSGFGAKVCS